MYNIEDKLKDTEDALKNEFQYSNKTQIPKITKVVIHRGMGEAVNNTAVIEQTYKFFYSITGQKPVLTRAKKSISNFKLREGQVIGCKVTLRSKKMMAFLTNLINLSLPKIRDFRGINTRGYDGRSSFTFGIKDDSIFPESSNDLTQIRGMDITICTSASSKEEVMFILKSIGLPFR